MPHRLNDFLVCSPQEHFETETRESRWEVATVVVDGQPLAVLQAETCVMALMVCYPLLGDPDRAEQFLEDSNLEACFPLDAWSVLGGYDNHFVRSRRTLFTGAAGLDLVC